MNDGADFRPSLMPRRQFLLLGSSAIVGAAATSLPAEILCATFADSTLPLLSVGYFAGTAADLTSAGLSDRLVSAASLRSGDASLASSGIRLKVHQFSRLDARRAPQSTALNVLYRIDERDDQKVPFAAWTHSLTAAGEQHSSMSRFVVPVTTASPLELTVARRAPRAAQSAAADFAHDEDFRMTEGNGRSVAAFSVGRERGANKLRRGIYVLALRTAEHQRMPDWQSIRFIAPVEGSAPVLARASFLGHEPVSFDYIAVAVESA